MKRFTLFAATILTALVLSNAVQASECGDPVGDDGPTTTDALHILKASVGARECTLAFCDLNSDCRVSVQDALRALVASVGGDAPMGCDGECPTEQPCGDSDTPTCNGICPVGYVCSADEIDDVDPDRRVTLCHVPPGNHSNAHTITVGRSAVNAHLRHGDYEGPCEDDSPDCSEEEEGCGPVSADSVRDSDSDSDGEDFGCACAPVHSTPGYDVTVEILNNAGLIGALQFDINHTGANGAWQGQGGSVACSWHISGGLAVCNDVSSGRVRCAYTDLSGFQTPAPVISCIFRTDDPLSAADFNVRVVDATSPDLDPATNTFVPASVNMAVTSVVRR